MLGYITVNKDELKIRENEVYQGYYCGICKSVGRRIGQIPRMTLSYDIVFLSLLLGAINEEKDQITKEHCIIHPIEKKSTATGDFIDYSADMMILLAYHKFNDDCNDEKSFTGYAGKAALTPAYKKLSGKYENIAKAVEENLKALSELEKAHSGSIDQTGETFGNIMEVIFTGFYQDEKINRILGIVGKSLGKWVYAIDAIDDYKEDIEKNRYNPFIYRKNNIEEIEPILYNYLADTVKAVDLLPIYKNKGIIDNVLFLGLRAMTENVIKKSQEG